MYLNGFSDVPKIFSSIQRRNFFIIHKTHCNLRQSTFIAFLLVSILISTVLMREARLRCEFLFISQTTWLKHWDAPSIWPHHQLCTDLRKVGSWGRRACLSVIADWSPSPPNPLIWTLEAQHSSNNQQKSNNHQIQNRIGLLITWAVQQGDVLHIERVKSVNNTNSLCATNTEHCGR